MCKGPSSMKQLNAVAIAAVAAILVVTFGSGCSPQVKIDIGRLVVAHQDASWMDWSIDDTTLYWKAPNETSQYTLHAVDLQTGAVHSVIDGHDDADSPTLAAGDSMLFFMAGRTDAGSLLFQAPLAYGRAGTAVPIATNVWRYVVSLDGTRVALVQAGTGELSTIDVGTGMRQTFGPGEPTAFSPDGTRLLGVTTANGASACFLADPVTGASEPLAIPGNRTVTVLSWEGGSPRRVLPYEQSTIVDVMTGQTQQLPNGFWRLQALSGDPAEPSEGYFWAGQCLESQVDEVGEALCVTNQGLLYRVDLNTGRSDVVAEAYGGLPVDFAVSQDGRLLATRIDLDRVENPSIYVKTLSPPP